MLKKNSLSLVGILSGRGFKDYFCDKLFLGVDGFDLDFGISTSDPEEANLNKLRSQKKLLLLQIPANFKEEDWC